ncbi:MAG: FAD-containing monooxygenase EthA [Nevskiales bacterium]|nr:FAD-containing monooxygenase EthA [Nevskiales bacterium]
MAFDAARPEAIDFDVLIVGAGLSGVDAAYRLQTECPDKTYTIVEARDAIGGTWDLFRYPGIRSDSDMSTLGFPFEPWDSDVSIADGDTIRQYIQDTAAKYGIDRQIRFGHRVTGADWNSELARWLVSCQTAGGEQRFSCRFLHVCSGYYDYASGYTPAFANREAFDGTIVHPQHWPEDLDVAGKRIVVIGSGATAITLIPSLVKNGAQVTMLQRSPTYVVNLPRRDAIAGKLRQLLPQRMAGSLTRWKNILLSMYFYQYARRKPDSTREKILHFARQQLGDAVDADLHFNPSYKPWDQRLCIAPNGDLFRALRKGNANIVTDHIERFEAEGVRTRGGELLEADIIVTATGLNIQLFGGATLSLDGQPVETGERLIYKGMMLDGVPNMAFAFGYTNASWTLKCDLTAQYVCRLLQRMDKRGEVVCIPERREGVVADDMVDLESGYIQRAKDFLPQQGTRAPWRVHQNYVMDLAVTRFTKLDDGTMRFLAQPSRTESPAKAATQAA